MNQKLIIGNIFPIDTSGMSYNVPNFLFLGNESSMLIWKIYKPMKTELDAFKYESIRIGILRYDKIAFFCIEQDTFAEGDSSFHYNFTNIGDKHIMKTNTDVGLPVYLCVVDQNNVLQALRCINLNKEITNYISHIIEAQRQKENNITSQEYAKLVQSAYKKYNTSADMMAESRVIQNFPGHIIHS